MISHEVCLFCTIGLEVFLKVALSIESMILVENFSPIAVCREVNKESPVFILNVMGPCGCGSCWVWQICPGALFDRPDVIFCVTRTMLGVILGFCG